MFYKKKLFVVAMTFTLFLMTLFTNAQKIIVMLKQPPPNQWHVEDLWQLTLTNTSQETCNVYLYGTVEEADAGLIVEGTSAIFELMSGFSGPVNRGDLDPANVGYTDSDYEEIVMRTGTLPEGTYKICVYVKNYETDEQLGYDCIIQSILHPSPPELINPVDEANVTEELPVFLWLPPMPMGEFVSYTIKIVELMDGQMPIEAMGANPAFYIEEDIPATSFQFPISARPFESGIRYAWKVTAISGDDWVLGESPVWSFNYEAAAVVLYEEPATLELISPVNGEIYDSPASQPIIVFEWTPIDRTFVTLVVTPEASYTLTIWKLTEDLAERIMEGDQLIEEDLVNIEPYYINESIDSTFLIYPEDADNPLVPGFVYGWQVVILSEDTKLSSEYNIFFFFETQEFILESVNPDTILIGEETQVIITGKGFTPDLHFLVPYDSIDIIQAEYINPNQFNLTFSVKKIIEPGTYPFSAIGPSGNTSSISINMMIAKCKEIVLQIEKKNIEIGKAKDNCKKHLIQKSALQAKLNNLNRRLGLLNNQLQATTNTLQVHQRKLNNAQTKIQNFIDRTFFCDFIGSDPSKGENYMDLGGGKFIYFSGSENSIYWLGWFLQEYRDDLREQRAIIKEAEQNIAVSNNQINALNAKIKKLEAKKVNLKNEQKTNNDKLKQCKDKVAALKKELKELIDKNKYCTSWIKLYENTKKKIQESQDSLRMAEAQIDEANNVTKSVGNNAADSLLAEARRKAAQAQSAIDDANKALENGDFESARARANNAIEDAEDAQDDAEDSAAEIECTPEGDQYTKEISVTSFTILDRGNSIIIKHQVTGERMPFAIGRQAIHVLLKMILKKILVKSFPIGTSTTVDWAFEILIPIKTWEITCKEVYICEHGKWKYKETTKERKYISRNIISYKTYTLGGLAYYLTYADKDILQRFINDEKELKRFKCK